MISFLTIRSSLAVLSVSRLKSLTTPHQRLWCPSRFARVVSVGWHRTFESILAQCLITCLLFVIIIIDVSATVFDVSFINTSSSFTYRDASWPCRQASDLWATWHNRRVPCANNVMQFWSSVWWCIPWRRPSMLVLRHFGHSSFWLIRGAPYIGLRYSDSLVIVHDAWNEVSYP